MRAPRRPIHTVSTWVKRQPPKVKAFLAVVSGMTALVFLRFIVHDHDNLFVAAEAVHALGISVLIYKLMKEKTCAGLSLKSQELTAIFLAVRLYCSFVMEYDIHTLLDTATLGTTLWVIYMIRFKLKSSYMEDKDNFAIYYVVVPCVLLALVIHPSTSHNILNRICWAFCVYLEAVSVLPQLRVMQNTKIVEPFTAHYVFALGVARFLSCAHWVLQVLDTRGRLLTALGYGMWPSMVLLSEIVQTFILADFCYYYVKSLVGGQLVLRLPSGVLLKTLFFSGLKCSKWLSFEPLEHFYMSDSNSVSQIGEIHSCCPVVVAFQGQDCKWRIPDKTGGKKVRRKSDQSVQEKARKKRKSGGEGEGTICAYLDWSVLIWKERECCEK
ncbi:hypothetical protein NE237_017967 [Protea cynaroides]|uniref:ER lumen protein retaining receptor n=1 Tax=Protea cynaroides TaxID=273540 RepID=A0A9Q0QNK1_9MAGN|nr:hypothetical protein NE237_017967 [Protea cynaroides]